MWSRVLRITVVLSLAGAALSAQSHQRISMQGSALYANLFGTAYQGMQSGAGWEAQVRYTPGSLSVGGGIQRTDHTLTGFPNRVRLMGGFVEPRYVLAILTADWMAPYVSARVSLLEQRLVVGGSVGSATGLTANLGGGILFRVTRRVNGEAGATFGFTRFGTSTSGTPSGSGANLVVRAGLAMGLLR